LGRLVEAAEKKKETLLVDIRQTLGEFIDQQKEMRTENIEKDELLDDEEPK
jgi:hypothetical protein